MISVVLPTYNSASYVSETVQSIFRQTLLPSEVIFVDDCSSDGTVSVLRSARQSAPIECILLQNISNQGPSFSRNRGILAAKNNWISFIDSDDLWDDQHLESLFSHAIAMSKDFVYSGIRVVDIRNNKSLMTCISSDPRLDFPHVLYRSSPIMPSQALINKSFLVECGGFDVHLRHGEDSDLCLALYHRGIQISSTNMPTAIYRKREASLSQNLVVGALSSAYRMQKYVRYKDFSIVHLSYWAFLDIIAASRLIHRLNKIQSLYYLGLAFIALSFLRYPCIVDLKQVLERYDGHE